MPPSSSKWTGLHVFDLDDRSDLRNPCTVFHSLGISLAFLLTVDIVETNTLRVIVVEDFEGVAVEDSYHLA